MRSPSNIVLTILFAMKKFLFLSLLNCLLASAVYARTASNNISQYHPITVRTVPEADTAPLIVVNGKILGTTDKVRILDSLSSDDIERMDVWKDTAAIRRYGQAGKAGVIELTIKPSGIKKLERAGLVEAAVDKPEIEADFPGGSLAWRRFLERNLNGDVPVKNKAPDGTYTVIIEFMVDKAGNLGHIRALTNHGYGMEEEVIRLISRGPKWKPAINNGQIVASYRKQPVTFVVLREK